MVYASQGMLADDSVLSLTLDPWSAAWDLPWQGLCPGGVRCWLADPIALGCWLRRRRRAGGVREERSGLGLPVTCGTRGARA